MHKGYASVAFMFFVLFVSVWFGNVANHDAAFFVSAFSFPAWLCFLAASIEKGGNV